MKPLENSPASEPIALIGIGCRFPGATDTESFWRLLHEGVDAISDFPADRFDVDPHFDPRVGTPGKIHTRAGGFLDGVFEFDPLFFGLSRPEATSMDPQQRLLLEVAWEAFEDAGVVPGEVDGERVGVYVGMCCNEYEDLHYDNLEDLDLYAVTGGSRFCASGRISYHLGFEGPSLTVDTACSSSLTAVHLACQSLRSGETRLALACGSQMILELHMNISLSQAGMLTPTGRCRFGAEGVDGYTRSEAVAAVLLKPLADALEDGDPIHAVIRGTAVNCDGRSSRVLVKPSVDTQKSVVRHACRDAGIEPGELHYVEAHGTGTEAGDAVELAALGGVLGQGRPAGRPCPIGSVKSNVGHSEAASGMAGLIKTALALRHRTIPASLHAETLNPEIPWRDLPLYLNRERSPWPESEGPRLAGVNSFGLSGSNAHLVLESAPEVLGDREGGLEDMALASLLPLSAHGPDALRELVESYRRFLARPAEGRPDFRDVCFTATLRRTHHPWRCAVAASSAEAAAAELQALLDGPPDRLGRRTEPEGRRPIVFAFSGQGSQWSGMGRELLEEEVCRRVLKSCDEILRPLVEWSLIDELTAPEGTSRLEETEVAQPALFALEVAVAELWCSWGVVPDAVVGHSVGEIAAAHVAGVLDLGMALALVVERGRQMQRATGLGRMAMVGLGLDAAEAAIEGTDGRLHVAASNSPMSTVVAGDGEALAELLARLESEDVFCRWLPVDYAFHTPQMAPHAAALRQAFEGLEPRPAALPIYSTVDGRKIEGRELDAAYWERNVREPVRFAAAIEALAGDGYRLFLEVGPHPVLTVPLAQCLGKSGHSDDVLASLHRDRPARTALLGSLGALYRQGYPFDARALFPRPRRAVRLPFYPFQRQDLRISTARPGGRNLGGTARPADGPVLFPWLGRRLRSAAVEAQFEADYGVDACPFLDQHRINGVALVPGAAFLASLQAGGEAVVGAACEIEDVVFREALALGDEERRWVQTVLAPAGDGTWSARIVSLENDGAADPGSGWRRHATARLRAGDRSGDAGTPAGVDLVAVRSRCAETVEAAEFYAAIRRGGIDLGPAFQLHRSIYRRDGEALAELDPERSSELGASPAPTLLDACFQALCAALPGGYGHDLDDGDVLVPVGAVRFRVHGDWRGAFRDPVNDPPRLWCYAELNGDREPGLRAYEGRTVLMTEDRGRLLEIDGISIHRIAKAQLVADAARRGDGADGPFWEVVWESAELPEVSPRDAASGAAGTWLVLAHPDGVGEGLARKLAGRGGTVVTVRPGDGYEALPGGGFRIDPACPEDWRRLLAEALGGGTCAGVIHAWTAEPCGSGDAAAAWTAGPEALDAIQEQGPESVLHLVRSLLLEAPGNRGSELPRLWLVTRGGPSPGNAPMPAASLLWGFGRSVAQEHPELAATLVDLPPSSDPAPDRELAALERELLARDRASDDQIFLSGDRRLVARLAPRTVPAVDPEHLRADATYLLTGGLGGLGLGLAGWMAARGARHLALLGRGGASSPEAATAVAELESRGVNVRVLRADVADADQIAAALATVDREMPPLRGVVHAAGVLRDATLLEMNREALAAVLAPKVLGARHLHTLTAGRDLELFVLFSSVASLLGTAGQANYAAANAFLDGLAHHRTTLGLPALAVNWGPWAQVGMAAATAERGERLAAQGLISLEPEEALDAFGHLLADGAVQAAVVEADWRRWTESRPTSLLAAYADAGSTDDGSPVFDRESLATLDPEARRVRVREVLIHELAAILSLPATQLDEHLAVTDLGLDSLMALEMKNRIQARLGVALGVSKLFQGHSVARLADEVLAQLLDAEPAQVPVGAAGESWEDGEI